METIIINGFEELNYSICSFLLKNKIKSATIHCPEIRILRSIELYMVEIGIPFAYFDNVERGICLTLDNIIKVDAKVHMFINLNKKAPVIEKAHKNYVVFEIHNVKEDEIEKLVKDFKTFDITKVPIHLQNQEIKKMFLQTFLIAEHEIDIISPWMNGSVVNGSLINLMDSALRKGVKIRIIYGLAPSDNEYDMVRSNRSDGIAALLTEKFRSYGKHFAVKRNNIHYKLVLCDEKFKLEGSYNYLSFTGDYGDGSTRIEGSPFGRDAKEIRFLRERYFENFGEN